MTWNQIKFGDPFLPNCLWDRYMEDEDGCWIKRTRNQSGTEMYRLIYELAIAPIPYGYVLDHLCRASMYCINPNHLEAVTQQENTLRSIPYRKQHGSQLKASWRRSRAKYFARPDVIPVLPGESFRKLAAERQLGEVSAQ